MANHSPVTVTGSSKVMTTLAPPATSVAPLTGLVVETAGGMSMVKSKT
jgi:hypothetical protein